MKPETQARFGQHIRIQREEAGLSVQKLAKLAGISAGFLSKVENGLASPPSEEIIRSLAEVLELSIDALLLEAGVAPPDIVEILRSNPELLESLRR